MTFTFLILTGSCLLGQEIESKENFGRTLNAGSGFGYYKYVGYPVQTYHLNYEFQIDNNLTVAPFINMYAYHSTYFWGDVNNTPKTYNYSETVVPVGLKVSYYFDELFNAGHKWDFYSSGSLGFVYRKTLWETSYTGKNQINPGMGPLYLDFHIGSEYHLTNTLGIQIDVSTSMSTLGLAIHLPN